MLCGSLIWCVPFHGERLAGTPWQDVDPYVYMIPPLGQHYSAVWAEQDRIAAGGVLDESQRNYALPGTPSGPKRGDEEGG